VPCVCDLYDEILYYPVVLAFSNPVICAAISVVARSLLWWRCTCMRWVTNRHEPRELATPVGQPDEAPVDVRLYCSLGWLGYRIVCDISLRVLSIFVVSCVVDCTCMQLMWLFVYIFLLVHFIESFTCRWRTVFWYG